MNVDAFESIILYVADLAQSRVFYVEFLGLEPVYADDIVVVLGAGPARVVLHRNDRGHDDRGIFPAGRAAGGAALRFSVPDPDEWERQASSRSYDVLWTTQDASWGRFVVLADPDGRPVVLARMTPQDRLPGRGPEAV